MISYTFHSELFFGQTTRMIKHIRHMIVYVYLFDSSHLVIMFRTCTNIKLYNLFKTFYFSEIGVKSYILCNNAVDAENKNNGSVKVINEYVFRDATSCRIVNILQFILM